MSEQKSRCPFAAFSSFGRKLLGDGHDAPPAQPGPAVAPGMPERTLALAGMTESQAAEPEGETSNAAMALDEIQAFRTLLKHASVVRGKAGNLLILPSISLPSGQLADAPEALRAWLDKVEKADATANPPQAGVMVL